MGLPRVSFPPLFRRTPDANALPVTLAPEPPPTTGVRYRGGGTPSAPASLREIGGDSGRGQRRATGQDIASADGLNSGPLPDRIDRETRALNAGAIGPSAAGWPYDANNEFVPHTDIPRNPGTVTPFAKSIDTGVTIPSIGVGSPVG